MYLADTLSRACIPGEGNAEVEEELSRVVHSLVLNIPASANKLSEIPQTTEQDPTLTKVRNLIMTRWPKSRKSVPPDVQSLWNIRDELYVAERIIFVGERVLIPATFRLVFIFRCYVSSMKVTWERRNAKHVHELSCIGQGCQRTSNTKSSNVQCA